MNSSEKDIRTKNDRKTKAQLQTDLEEAQNKLRKRKMEASIANKEAEKLQVQLQSMRKERDMLAVELEDLESESHDVEAYERLKEQYEDEREKWLEDTKKVEEMIAQQDEAHRTELEKIEKQRTSLKKQVTELEKKLNALQEKAAITADDIPTSKSAFRIDLYPHQEHIRGRIEHLLSQDKKAFSGIDAATISDFLVDHLPSEWQAADTVRTVGTHADNSKRAGNRETTSVDFPDLETVDVFTQDRVKPTRAIQCDRPFEVRLNLAIADDAETTDVELNYKASVFAKPLPGGTHRLIGEAKDIVKSSGSFAVNVLPHTLKPGVYRLEAAVSFNTAGKEKWPISAFQESGLIKVF